MSKEDMVKEAVEEAKAYVALSRCTSLEGISLQEPLRQSDVFVRNDVKQFARHYNDQSTINTALDRKSVV